MFISQATSLTEQFDPSQLPKKKWGTFHSVTFRRIFFFISAQKHRKVVGIRDRRRGVGLRCTVLVQQDGSYDAAFHAEG